MHERHHGSVEAYGAPPPGMASIIIPGKPNGRATFHGFTHMGRFAGNYRTQFAETPSQTLSRARLPLLVAAN